MKIFYSQDTNIKNRVERTNQFKISYLEFIIVLIGFLASFFTYILHLQLKMQSGSPLICDVNEMINCSKVIGSEHGEFFGLPLGVWGMVYWLLLLGLVFFPKFSSVSALYIAFWKWVVGTVGFLVSLALIFISSFVLSGICEFCFVVQLSCIAFFIVSFISYKKIRNVESNYFASKIDFIKLILVGVFSFVFSLFIFFLGESYFYYVKSNDDHSKIEKMENPQQRDQAPLLPLLDGDDVDFSKGTEDAPIKIIEFTDFECPYCQLLHERLEELKSYVDQGKIQIYFRNWPLSYHQFATKLAIAARCAGLQGKFWEFADWSFKTAKKFAQDNKKKEEFFSNKGIETKAKSLSLDLTQFRSCLKDESILDKIKKDSSDAIILGGQGTPFMLINSVPYEGNWLQPGKLEKDINDILEN